MCFHMVSTTDMTWFDLNLDMIMYTINIYRYTMEYCKYQTIYEYRTISNIIYCINDINILYLELIIFTTNYRICILNHIWYYLQYMTHKILPLYYRNCINIFIWHTYVFYIPCTILPLYSCDGLLKFHPTSKRHCLPWWKKTSPNWLVLYQTWAIFSILRITQMQNINQWGITDYQSLWEQFTVVWWHYSTSISLLSEFLM